MCLFVYVEVRGWPLRIGSFLPPCGFRDWTHMMGLGVSSFTFWTLLNAVQWLILIINRILPPKRQFMVVFLRILAESEIRDTPDIKRSKEKAVSPACFTSSWVWVPVNGDITFRGHRTSVSLLSSEYWILVANPHFSTGLERMRYLVLCYEMLLFSPACKQPNLEYSADINCNPI